MWRKGYKESRTTNTVVSSTADPRFALRARAMVEILPPGDDDGDGDRVALGNQIEEEEEEDAREELPVGAVESDFDVQHALSEDMQTTKMK